MDGRAQHGRVVVGFRSRVDPMVPPLSVVMQTRSVVFFRSSDLGRIGHDAS